MKPLRIYFHEPPKKLSYPAKDRLIRPVLLDNASYVMNSKAKVALMFYSLKFGFVVAVSMLMPVQASALRCATVRTSVDVINSIQSAPSTAVVGYGTFSTAEPSDSIIFEPNRSDYVFDGVLFQDGQVIPADPRARVVSTSCEKDTWCAGIPISFMADQEYLVVFDQNAATSDLHVHVGLCTSSVVLALDDANLPELTTCLSSGTCSGAQLGQ